MAGNTITLEQAAQEFRDALAAIVFRFVLDLEALWRLWLYDWLARYLPDRLASWLALHMPRDLLCRWVTWYWGRLHD